MAWRRLSGQGVHWPSFMQHHQIGGAFSSPAVGALDAAGEYIYGYGPVFWDDGQSHTVSGSGGKIHFRVGTNTWASSGTTIRVGIQDILTSATPARPDGTHDVYGELVQGTDSLTSNAVKTVNMSSGSKTIAHGQRVAVVSEMTVRNGSDSVGASTLALYGAFHTVGGWFTGGALTADGRGLNAHIEAGDGHLGFFYQYPALSALATDGFNVNTSGSDERGLIFRVEDPIKVDCLYPCVNSGGSTSGDMEVKVYDDPLGTPALKGSALTLNAEDTGPSTCFVPVPLAPGDEYEFWPGRDYCVAVRPTQTTNINLMAMTLANANARAAFSNGLNLRRGVRIDNAGAFTESTTIIPLIGFRISHSWGGPSPRFILGV